MNKHLRLLNRLIGFASSIEGWPEPLQEQGYILYWVGPSYLVSNGRKSNPDLLFVSKLLNHCSIFECKSGVSTDDEQLGALAATTKVGQTQDYFWLLPLTTKEMYLYPAGHVPFGVLADAQALGDLRALKAAGRRVARVHLSRGDAASMSKLLNEL